ncbi:MAG: hypothetical protein IJI49_03605 [Bacilli bacterium]|nr:hypothetical protein [Bacilli bacterium]
MLYIFTSDYYSIIVSVALFILIIICLILIHKITSLKEKVQILEIKNNYEKKVIVDKENTIPIKNISKEKKSYNNKKNDRKIELYKEVYPRKIEDNKAYTKNVLKENKITSPITIDNKEINITEFIPQNETNYLEEVSRKLKEEINNKPIELTEYEQEEELNAVISYKELLNKEDKTNKKEPDTKEFIDQLKKLRNSL